MPLRDRVQAAITGTSSSTGSQPSPNPNNERSLQRSRTGQARADPSTSMANINHRTSQLAIEGSSSSSPGSRFRPGQLAIEGSSSLTPTRGPRQNRLTGSTTDHTSSRAPPEPITRTLAIEGSSNLTPARAPRQNRLAGSTTNPTSGRAPPEPTTRTLAIEGSSTLPANRSPQQNRLTGSSPNPASDRALPEAAANTSPLPLARASRPYGSSGNQEAFTLDPSRRLGSGDSRRATGGSSTTPTGATNRANNTAAPGARKTTGEHLAPLGQREIIDVTHEDNLSARANVGRQAGDDPPRAQFQQPARAPNAPAPGSTPQRNQSSTRVPSSARFGNQDEGSAIPQQARRNVRETFSERESPLQPPYRPLESRSEPSSTVHALGESADQSQELYLGVFDLEETDQPAQQTPPNVRRGPSQSGNRSRSGTFGSSSTSSHTSTSSHRSTVVNHGIRVGPPFWPPYRPPTMYSYSYGYDWYSDWRYPWGGLPWFPRPYIALPRQTVFTEISMDYFEQESPATPNLDANTGLEVINRYYNGWRDAYTQALSYSDDISATDRARIERNRQRLQSRQDEAIRRLRDGDHTVVQETLDQVRMDRQMAVDMPAAQIRWATPWIREVWVTEHGEIPY